MQSILISKLWFPMLEKRGSKYHSTNHFYIAILPRGAFTGKDKTLFCSCANGWASIAIPCELVIMYYSIWRFWCTCISAYSHVILHGQSLLLILQMTKQISCVIPVNILLFFISKKLSSFEWKWTVCNYKLPFPISNSSL